jgi:hypothetical protein
MTRRARAEQILFDAAPLWLVLTLSGALGCAVGLRVFGLQYVLGTSAFWSYPVGDAVTMLTGWNYFVHESWHFPLTLTHATNPPGGVNIIYMDSIPIVAIFAKLIATLTSAQFHPYGIWHFTLYVLQAIFAALIARRLGMRGLLPGLACAALCVSTSAFLMRFYHEGLNAHFLVLWALLNYLRSTPGTRLRPLAIGWAANLFCALLIHPYLTTMCLAIATAAHLRMALTDRRRAAICAASGAAALGLAWIGAGYTFQKASQGEAAVFGLSSLNLMSPLVPYSSAFFGKWLPPATIQETTGFQWDGQNFLGFGVIALLVTALVAARRSVMQLVRTHWCLCVVLLILAMYAPGNRWALGKWIIFEIPLSDRVRGMLATFRGTGRFFWPVGYAIAIASAMVVVRRFGRRGIVAVSAAALFQLVDSSASWDVIHDAFVAEKRLLDWGRWERAVDGHTVVAALPSYSCLGGTASPHTYAVQRELEFIAAAHGKHTIDSRTARSFTDCAKQATDVEALSRDGLAGDTLYVLFPPAFDAERAARFGRHQCVEFDDGWVCSTAHRDVLDAAFAK